MHAPGRRRRARAARPRAARASRRRGRPRRPARRTARARRPRGSTGQVYARGGELHERRLRAGGDARPLVVLDLRGTARRGGRSTPRCAPPPRSAVHLAERGGCALLLPGERRPLAIDAGLRGWPQRTRGSRSSRPAAARSVAALARRRGALIWVAAARAARAAARRSCAARRRARACSSSRARSPGRAPAFTVAGCTGYGSAPARGPAATPRGAGRRPDERAAARAAPARRAGTRRPRGPRLRALPRLARVRRRSALLGAADLGRAASRRPPAAPRSLMALAAGACGAALIARGGASSAGAARNAAARGRVRRAARRRCCSAPASRRGCSCRTAGTSSLPGIARRHRRDAGTFVPYRGRRRVGAPDAAARRHGADRARRAAGVLAARARAPAGLAVAAAIVRSARSTPSR